MSKRKSTDEPPAQPVRSAYLLFHQEEREKELEAKGSVDFLEFAKLSGKKWNEKSDSFKAAYDKRCAEMQIKWFHDLAKWGAETGNTEFVQKKKDHKAKKPKGDESEVEQESRTSKKPQTSTTTTKSSATPSKEKAQATETPSKEKKSSNAAPPSGSEKKKKKTKS